MGCACASRKCPNDAFWETSSIRLSRLISATLLTAAVLPWRDEEESGMWWKLHQKNTILTDEWVTHLEGDWRVHQLFRSEMNSTGPVGRHNCLLTCKFTISIFFGAILSYSHGWTILLFGLDSRTPNFSFNFVTIIVELLSLRQRSRKSVRPVMVPWGIVSNNFSINVCQLI